MTYHHRNKASTIWILIFSMLLSFTVHAKSPAAGTLIKNQASATYKDAAGVAQFATSNLVETLIQQVAAMELIQDQSLIGVAGNTSYLPHILTNTGNGVDSYDLVAVNNGGDAYDFDSIVFYADTNKDGIPDSTTPINSSSTGGLAAGESFYFVIGAAIPSGATNGQAATLTVTGTSTFVETPTNIVVAKSNTDTVTISDKAIIDVTKSMSANSGASPSGLYTITLKYKNSGLSPATAVTLTDSLPAGMTYSNSTSASTGARWSETGVLVLTDANADAQGSGDTITYCAYSAGCVNQVSAVISQVAAGGSGEITFEINIAAGLPTSTLINIAKYSYNDGSVVIPPKDTNQVPFDIIHKLGVIANGSDSNAADGADNLGGVTDSFIVSSASRGASVPFDNIIRNTGNADDTFEITIDEAGSSYPAGTVFQLFKSDGFTPLIDSNNNGTVDTGIMVAGDRYKVVLRAVLPANATGNNDGAGFEVTKTATSALDDSVFNTVKDHLNEITLDSVDLTNDSAGSVAPGAGAGPEATAVTTENIAQKSQATFKLFVNNTSDTANSYQLEYSKDKPFVAGSLEENWGVDFYFDGGNADCSTLGQVTATSSNIPAGANQQICAVVTAPANAVAGIVYPIYFRIISALSGASDIKHDAVMIISKPALSIEPNQIGQVEPGSTVIYSHHVTNNGNTALECVNVTSVDSDPQSGWSSIIYKDVNKSGKLDAADTPLVNQTLAVGQSFPILIKLFAPATAAMGEKNIQALTVKGHQDNGDANPATCVGTLLTNQVQDVTTVSTSKMSIIKEQAVDADCNGSADGSFLTTVFQVQPKTCVIYRLTATNTGSTTVKNARIDDAAPTFTQFFGTPIVSPVAGNIVGGVTETDGDISGGSVNGASISVAPGNTLVLTFGVKLD